MSRNTYAVYLPTFTDASSWKPVFVDSMSNIHTLIEKILDQLPNPQELSDNHFEVSKMFIICYSCITINYIYIYIYIYMYIYY